MSSPLTLVAILTVRMDALASFREFETHAARIMARYGGRMERAVVVAQAGEPETIKEIHVVTFPGQDAFAAYRGDGELARFAHLRAEAVLHSEVLVGVDGPDYAAG